MKVGETYRTVGGWDAIVVWISGVILPSNSEVGELRLPSQGFYAIHKPNTKKESGPIWHFSNGTVGVTFAVNEAPCYDQHHPADIILPSAGDIRQNAFAQEVTDG